MNLQQLLSAFADEIEALAPERAACLEQLRQPRGGSAQAFLNAGAEYRDGMQGEKSRHSERSGKIFERSRPPENQMAAPKGACSESPQDDDTFFAAVQDYASQMQRLADAAHTAELDGIAAASALVVENAMLLAVADEAERSAALAFLAAWPNHLLQCLRQPDNSAIAQALVQHLCAAPQALGSAAALNLMHQLGSMGQQAQTLGTAATQPAPSPTAADISAALSLQPPADLDPDLLHSFYQEAPQQARTLVGLVQAFGLTTASQAQQEQLIQMQRLAHTLKGTGAIFGLQGLISMAHPLEDIFEQLQNTTARPHPDLPQLLNTALEAAYCLEQMVACVAGQDEPPAQAPAVLQKLGQAQQLLGLAAHNPQPAHPPNPSPAPQSSPSAEPASEAPRAAPAEPGLRVGQTAMENLFRLSAQISLASTAQQGRLKKIDARVQQLLAQNTRWQKNLAALGDALQQQNAATPQQGAGFDPLEFDQFQAWQEQLLSLQETAHDHQLLAWRIHAEVQDWALAQQADTQAVQALQHQVLQTRMRSAGSIRARAERAVHITAQSTGKRARLHLTGDAVDMDAALLGSLLSPLMHMLRNAVDHGIESPEQRQAAGKPAEGCVQLQFARQGSQIVLRCQDDGRGLDWAKVRQRGLDLGLLQAEQNCTPAELARLIFSPGFSTRSQVNQISGRGVGLDVVHSWAASVGGTVDVLQQAQAVGLCLELRFPATLAMQPALLVQAAGQKFALPAAQITQALAANMGQWEESATGLHFTHEGQRLPAHRLSHIVGLQSLDAPPLAQCAVVLIQHQHASTALAVDALLDAGQWLVQDLGRFSRHAKGATGVSVLEDGGLAVHLDLSTLLKQNLQPATQTQAKAPLGRPALPHILVVDDAYSVRSSLKQLLQDAGYRVSTARDGLEAIASLQAHPAHIVLTDLEMPNMNGAELAAHLRASADSQTLPIVMISSRTQDKHRQLAAAAGVNAYLGKPYVEAELLALIQRFLTEKPL